MQRLMTGVQQKPVSVLRAGGAFMSRVEARGSSFGFDFTGTCTRVLPNRMIEYLFGDRAGTVELATDANGVTVRQSTLCWPPDITVYHRFDDAGVLASFEISSSGISRWEACRVVQATFGKPLFWL